MDGKLTKLPTEKGAAIGIRAERRESLNGSMYIALIYNKCAQQFIVDNLDKML